MATHFAFLVCAILARSGALLVRDFGDPDSTKVSSRMTFGKELSYVFRSTGTFEAESPGRPVIVQAFTGNPLNLTVEELQKKATQAYWASGMLLNFEYAKRHDYNYIYFAYAAVQTGETGACVHPKKGPMDSNWCKALAIQAAIHMFSSSQLFFWADSDVAFTSMDKPFEPYMQSAKAVREPQDRSKVLIFAWDNWLWPGTNSGAVILRRSDRTEEFVERWILLYNETLPEQYVHPYDQNGFNWLIDGDFVNDTVTFKDHAFRTDGELIVHRCGRCPLPQHVNLFTSIAKANGLLPWDATSFKERCHATNCLVEHEACVS